MKWIYLVGFFLVALMLGPGLAHLFEMPNKMLLAEADYFTVQGIYRGWSLFGWVVGAAMIATLALVFSLKGQRTAMLWAIAAFAAVVGSQVLFWIFVFPANQATANWTVVPDNWRSLRRQWEYGHAASALLDIGALMAMALSALAWRGARHVAPEGTRVPAAPAMPPPFGPEMTIGERRQRRPAD